MRWFFGRASLVSCAVFVGVFSSFAPAEGGESRVLTLAPVLVSDPSVSGSPPSFPFDPLALRLDDCLGELAAASASVVRPELPFPLSAMVDGRAELLTHYLGRSSAAVYVARDRRRVFKFARSWSLGLLHFEIAATSFLQERGYQVVSVLSGPHRVEPCPAFLHESDAGFFAGQPHCWVLSKEYVHGMTRDEVLQFCHSHFGFDPARLERCLLSVDLSYHEYRELIAQHFRSGEFHAYWDRYLKALPGGEGLRFKSSWIDEGDLHRHDFLLSVDGWFLLDP